MVCLGSYEELCVEGKGENGGKGDFYPGVAGPRGAQEKVRAVLSERPGNDSCSRS